VPAVPALEGRGVTAGKRRHSAPVRSEDGTTGARPVRTAPSTSGGPGPASTDSDLAVLVLQTSWALADAAHDLPAGRMPPRRRAELADTLSALGYVLRVTAPAPDGER
jgi:hypothetical protein